MKIAICDDDQHQCQEVKKYCQKYSLEKNEYQIFHKGEDLLKSLEEGDIFDLLFQDINMPGIDGIETTRRIRENNNKLYIIFMTSLMEYAMEGYQLSVNDFILKPMTAESFERAFERAKEALSGNIPILNIKTKNMGKSLPFDSILYIEAFGRKLEIVTRDGSYEIYGSLGDEEEQLTKFDFMRVHRSYLVNLNAIDQVFNRGLIMCNQDEIPVSKKRHQEVYDAYTELQFKKYK